MKVVDLQTTIKKAEGNKLFTLGERIAAARQIKGWDQATLASKIGVTRATVSDWELNKVKDLRGVNLFKLASELEVNAKWIAINEGGMARRYINDDQEYELLSIYRTLKKEGKTTLLSVAKAMQTADTQKPTAQQPFTLKAHTPAPDGGHRRHHEADI